MKQKFTINKLNWEEVIEGEYYAADTPWGDYEIRDFTPWGGAIERGQLNWGFKHREIADCDSVEDGKRQAEEHYKKYITESTEFFTPVKEDLIKTSTQGEERIKNPNWENMSKPLIHDWRGYVDDDTRKNWDKLSTETKRAIYNMAEDQSGKEETAEKILQHFKEAEHRRRTLEKG